MFEHLEGSVDNMLSTFAVVTRPAMAEPQEMAKEAGKWHKIVQNRPKIAEIAQNRNILALAPSLSGPNINIFNIYKASGRVNIQHCCQHLQRMESTSNINSCGLSINVLPDGYTQSRTQPIQMLVVDK